MAFVNASLLAGGLLIAIPIVLHLAMRKQPKPLVFPALRFVQQKKLTNQRRLQWRQWLLLLLRCLLVGLLALAFARPSAASASAGSWTMAVIFGLLLCFAGPAAIIAWRQRQSRLTMGLLSGVAVVFAALLMFFTVSAMRKQPPVMLGDNEAPVAAALVFDTSPRMQYRRDNRTRIEQAQEIANWLVQQLPRNSQLAVLDSQLKSPVFSVDQAAAMKTIQRLEPSGSGQSLGRLVSDALRLLDTSSLDRKEIYIFTDMTKSAWEGAAEEVALDTAPNVNVYVLDVGVDNPQNVSLGAIRMESNVVARNSPLQMEVDVRSQGAAASRQIELLVERLDSTRPVVIDGKIQTPAEDQRDRKAIPLDANGSATVRFSIEETQSGLRQGRIRMLGEDGLSIDDVRYFTFRVDEAWPILVAAPDNAWTVFFTQAIAPDDEREQGRNRYEIQEARQVDLDTLRFEDYVAVCLLDPKPLTDSQWTRLFDYLNQGGSLGLFLGRNANPAEAFHSKAAQQVMPGTLSTQWRAAGRELFLRIDGFQHPVTRVFEPFATSTPWQQFPVERHWLIDPIRADAQTLVRFSNGKPCVVERMIGRGRAVIMTTPLSDPSASRQRRLPWNELASGADNWPPFLLTNSLMEYLVASGDARLNYLTGETAILPNNSASHPERYQMFLPQGQPFEVRARENRVSLPLTDMPGAYRLKGVRGGPVIRGFAVNWPASESDLTRMPTTELNAILGDGRYQFATRKEEIERVQGTARVGREFYPLLMFVLALMLALEHVLANRFYPPERAAASSANARAPAASS